MIKERRISIMYYESAKILSIELINFARIKTGMGLGRVFVDFTKYDYKTFLLIGENGSGKTSFMRCLHPFAYNSGSGDDSNNQTLIEPGKDGYKTIVIGYHDHVYTIKHTYERKKGTLSVKSFIMEDGEELNDSGTVNQFKFYVKDRLGIDESFLGLLSLGNSISGFVDHTSSERKKYAVKIFQELNIFNTYYKNATSAARSIKSNLTSITNRLQQYRYQQRDDMEQTRIELERNINALSEQHRSLVESIGTLKNQLENGTSLLTSYEDGKRRITELFQDVQKLQSLIHSSKDEVVLRNELREVESSLSNTNVRIGVVETTLARDLEDKERKLDSLNTIQTNLTRMEQNIDLKELTSLLAKLEADLQSLDLEHFKRPPYSTEELIRSNIYLDELRGLCIDLVNDVNNPSLIPIVLERYAKDPKLTDTIARQYNDLVENAELYQTIHYSRNLLSKMSKRKIKKSCNVEKGCPYVDFYQMFQDVVHQSVEETEVELEKKRDEINVAKDMVTISTTLKKLYGYIRLHEKEFQLPTDVFDPATFVISYIKDSERQIYDASLLAHIIDLCERFDQKDRLEEQITSVKNQLSGIEKSEELCASFRQQIITLESELDILNGRLEDDRSDYEFNKQQKDRYEKQISDLNKELENVMKLANTRLEINVVKQELALMEGQVGNLREVQEQLERSNKREQELLSDLNAARTRLQQLTNVLHMIDELTSQQAELQNQYSQVLWIQEAVNPTKGIPLEFISYYIKRRMVNIINPLLDTVYHGKLRILGGDNIIINESEFTIPYIWNGTMVPDISYGSDGQKAIMMLTFSIALLDLTTVGNYNIPLLDEMDTTLDDRSRAAYIDLIENYQSSQIFVISHSSMFDGRHVNLILTSPRTVSNIPEGQIIKLYEGGDS